MKAYSHKGAELGHTYMLNTKGKSNIGAAFLIRGLLSEHDI